MSLERVHLLAGGRIPNVHDLLMPAGSEPSSVRAKRHTDRLGVVWCCQSHPVGMAEALKVMPFPFASADGTIVKQLFDADQVALPPTCIGQGNVVEVLIKAGLLQGMLGIASSLRCLFEGYLQAIL